MIVVPAGPCPHCGVVDDVCACARLLEVEPGGLVTAYVDEDAVDVVRSILRGPKVEAWSIEALCLVIARTVAAPFKFFDALLKPPTP